MAYICRRNFSYNLCLCETGKVVQSADPPLEHCVLFLPLLHLMCVGTCASWERTTQSTRFSTWWPSSACSPTARTPWTTALWVSSWRRLGYAPHFQHLKWGQVDLGVRVKRFWFCFWTLKSAVLMTKINHCATLDKNCGYLSGYMAWLHVN